MPTDRDRAISHGTAFGARLVSLTMAMHDQLDEPDPPPPGMYPLPPSTNHFSTYAAARRTFGMVLTEEFSLRSFTHHIILQDYSNLLRGDVGSDMSFLRSLDEDGSGADGAAVIARWDSWQAVENRWPYRVPTDCSRVTKEQVELMCREMWTALRVVGKAALVLGEGKPGDAVFSITADGYVAQDGAGSSGSPGLYRSILGCVSAGVGAGKSIKRD